MSAEPAASWIRPNCDACNICKKQTLLDDRLDDRRQNANRRLTDDLGSNKPRINLLAGDLAVTSAAWSACRGRSKAGLAGRAVFNT